MCAVPLRQLGQVVPAPAQISTAPILGSIVGEEKTYGALEGRTPAGPLTFARLTTDDRAVRSELMSAKAR